MVLNDIQIKNLIATKGLVTFSDLENSEVQVQPASIDLRLGRSFKVIDSKRTGIINPNVPMKYTTVEQDTFVIQPHQFILATTMETINLPNNLTSFVEGRSSIGRMGLFVQNAGWVDPGFKGEITFELFNATDCPIILESGMRIAQLVFCTMDSDCENPYNGKYQNQRGATASMIYRDIDLNIKEVN